MLARLLISTSLLLASQGTPASPSLAQAARAEGLRILRMGTPPAATIVDGIPRGFPQALIPIDATPIVGAVGEDFSTAVLQLKGLTPPARARFFRRLWEAGWRSPAPVYGGFRNVTPGGLDGEQLCKPDEAALFLFFGDSPSQFVRVSYAAKGKPPCDTGAHFALDSVPYLPSLLSPQGALSGAVSNSSKNGDFTSESELETEKSLQEVGDCYIEQMKAVGWVVSTRQESPERMIARLNWQAIDHGAVAVLTLTKRSKTVGLSLVARPIQKD